ncbi:MAG: hypothetical protein H0W78_13590 [Planctomycetes bacterium]|nr:hypothetical protein [Planctomycetota bacterium]
MDATKTSEPVDGASVRRAVGAVAEVLVDQVRDLTVAQLDCWAKQLHQRLEKTADPTDDVTDAAPPGKVKPLVIGAIAGVVVAWLLAGRRAET